MERPLLLIHTWACRKQRMDRIKQLRWRQRSLPEDVQTNLSPQEIQVTHPPTHPPFGLPCPPLAYGWQLNIIPRPILRPS